MIELTAMEQEKPSSKAKILLVGPEKHGKSWTAATARKPILFHDFDNRRESIAGKPGVYAASYHDKMWPSQPDAASDFLTILEKMEDNLDLQSIGFKNAPVGAKVRTNVIDSVATMGRAFQRYTLFGSSDLRREIGVGKIKIQIPYSFDGWNAEMTAVEGCILRLLALPCDTIIVLHETAEEAPDSSLEKPKYTGRVAVYPARYKLLLKYFNEVWRVKLTQTVDPATNKSRYLPKIYPLPDYQFDAATALNLNAVEDPDIGKILARFE